MTVCKVYAMEKCFASTVCERLNFQIRGRLLNTQRGFRAGKSTEQVIFTKIEHPEYADDLCLITPSIGQTELLLQKLKTSFDKYVMEMAFDKRVCMYVGADLDQSALQIKSSRINSFICLGSPVNDIGPADVVPQYGLSTIIFRKVDDTRFMTAQNTA
ncbi:hypothetical protein ACTXT7_008114 [Hymenolepis weldensis]